MEDHGYYGTPKLFEVLLDDATQALTETSANRDSQYLRRNAIRAVFGFVEAVCTVLCNEVRTKHLRGQLQLTEKEKKVVEGIERDLLERVKKAFSSYAKLRETTFKLNTSSAEFEYFKEAKEIRDSLTHPTRYVHVLISDSQMFVTAKAYIWIKDEFLRLMNSALEATYAALPEEDREDFCALINRRPPFQTKK